MLAIVFYIVNSFSNEIDKYEEEINKLKENLEVNKRFINIQGDINYLKEVVGKNVKK